MKNNPPEAEVGSASSAMGGYLTAVVTACVLIVTVSALLSGGGVRDFRPLEIVVSERIENGQEIGGALRDLLAIETGRSVRLAEQPGEVCGDCDVFLMLHSEFGELLEKKPKPSVAGYMGMSGEDGRQLTETIVIVSRPDGADYLGEVVNRAAARVKYPGGDERVLAAVKRLEAAGAGHLTGPQTRDPASDRGDSTP
jgi:hypothetical protein